MSIRKRLVYCALILVTAVGWALAQSVGQKVGKASYAQWQRTEQNPFDLQAIADKLNETLPTTIGGVRLGDNDVVGGAQMGKVSVSGNELNHHFTLPVSDHRDIGPNMVASMRRVATQTTCQGMKNLLKTGVIVTYHYYSSSGVPFACFHVALSGTANFGLLGTDIVQRLFQPMPIPLQGQCG